MTGLRFPGSLAPFNLKIAESNRAPLQQLLPAAVAVTPGRTMWQSHPTVLHVVALADAVFLVAAAPLRLDPLTPLHRRVGRGHLPCSLCTGSARWRSRAAASRQACETACETLVGRLMAVGAVATGAPPERLSLSPHESSLQRGNRLPTGSVSRGQPRLSLVRARSLRGKHALNRAPLIIQDCHECM
jgi:hypothetical protein